MQKFVDCNTNDKCVSYSEMQEVTRMLKIVYENYAEYQDDESTFFYSIFLWKFVLWGNRDYGGGAEHFARRIPIKEQYDAIFVNLNMLSRCLNWYIMILSSLLLIGIGLHLKSMGKHKIEWSLKFFIMFHRFTIWMMNSGMNIKKILRRITKFGQRLASSSAWNDSFFIFGGGWHCAENGVWQWAEYDS